MNEDIPTIEDITALIEKLDSEGDADKTVTLRSVEGVWAIAGLMLLGSTMAGR